MFEKVVGIAAVIVAIFFGIALALVASSEPPAAPERQTTGSGGLDFATALAQDLSDLPQASSFEARDGTALPYRRYPGAPGRYVVLIHGSAWHGMQFHAMAKRLAAAGLGTVIVPDMRGHGEAPARRGDIDHVGQLEEDIADLIVALRDEAGGRTQIVLGGHSSGGGFVIRFAGGTYGDMVDAFVLMAPFLKHDAPTTRPDSGGWAQPATRRIIGLTLLNAVGVTALNHLPVISFAMPKTVLDGPLGHTATTTYSHALNTSYAPRSDYAADLKAMTLPFLLIAGAEDEAFFADRYEPTIAPHAPGGTYVILPGIGHLGLVTDDAAFAAVEDFLKRLADD